MALYDVRLIITNRCGTDTFYRKVLVTGSSVNELQLSADAFKLFPNPAKTILTIENKSDYKMKKMAIFNILGQQVLLQNSFPKLHQINVASLPEGLYNITIEFEEGVINRKLEIIK